MKTIHTILYTVLITLLIVPNLFGQCFDDGHSTFKNQGWYSCNKSMNPIPERGVSHWIKYDFGYVYALDSIYLWNHNVWGETGAGVKSIIIDYSEDNINWASAGPFEIAKAPGSWKYTGTVGPTLNNAEARYIVITVLSTWADDAACAGIGEIRFEIGESTSSEEIGAISDISIKPNPAVESIQVSLPHRAEILTVRNALGQEVLGPLVLAGEEITIPISTIDAGIYFISASIDGKVYSKSFVKIE